MNAVSPERGHPRVVPRAVALPALLLALLALAGCASQVPRSISEAPAGNPGVPEVQADFARHEGARVRWGGTVAEIRNRPDHTELEIVARPLGGDGRPREEDRSAGRFIARVPAFLDPAIYERGRLVTVAGEITGLRRGTVGEYPYRFPVVAVFAHHLWEPLPERHWRGPCAIGDPWYPYGCGPHPWRYHPYWPYYW